MADTEQPSFQIEKLYVKDLSLEVPGAPQVFLEAQTPQLEIQVRHEARGFAEALFEVVLTVTVTARVGDKTVFLAEAAQAGIFALRNVPDKDVEPLLAVGCPSILYPYAREAISDLVSRGGFPPVLLSPVSFEAIYAQRRQQEGGAGTLEVATQ
ncbi:MAG TPA: protein-export chaperone SecB [Burkholderiales bacterium]|nr:protein-export chaperone SecB [Burkholderiales bacterium]